MGVWFHQRAYSKAVLVLILGAANDNADACAPLKANVSLEEWLGEAGHVLQHAGMHHPLQVGMGIFCSCVLAVFVGWVIESIHQTVQSQHTKYL